MAGTVEEVLSSVEDVEEFSFYGLVHWLAEVGKLIERIDHAAVAKVPRADDLAIAQHKDEVLEAQARLRRAMGSSLESPALTKRERPLAEVFLQDQVSKLQSQASSDERAKKGLERLRQILAGVKASPVAAESKAVRDLEVSIKAAASEWKEVSPILDKWEAGRHIFKTNTELQAFKRRYEDCKRMRESSGEKLEKALQERRQIGGNGRAEAEPEVLPAGWSAMAKKQAPPAASALRAANVRGAAAIAVDAAAKKRSAPAARTNSWGSAVVSFAQRLRAEAVAKVREEGQGEEDEEGEQPQEEEEEEPFWEEESSPQPAVASSAKARPTAPAVPKRPVASGGFVAPKGSAKPGPAPAPADLSSFGSNSGRRWGAAGAEAEAEAESEEEEVLPASKPGFAASAKKKGGKAKKKKGGKEDPADEEVPASTASSAAVSRSRSVPQWVSAVEAAFSGTVLQELLSPKAWRSPATEVAADERLADLTDRLPWSSPLGLVLPLDWKEFVGLEVDGGPQRTSKRGTSPALLRLQKNVPWLLTHYLTVVFFLALLHALSRFGLLILPVAMQVGLMLLPQGQLPQLGTPAQVLLLQAAQLLVWAGFLRSLWLMHLFVKMGFVFLIAGHAYVVAELGED